MKTQASILCFGEALWDVFPDEEVPGGAPMNVALRLSAYGHAVELLSRIGKDRHGEQLLRYLAGAGLSGRFIQADDRWPTGKVLVDTSDPLAVSYEIAEPAAWDFIDAGAYLQQADTPPDVLVYGSLATRNPTSRGALMQLLDEPGLNVFDVNLRPPFVDRRVIESLLEKSHWAKLNNDELERIGAWVGKFDTLNDAARGIKERFGLDAVCVTLGGDGAMLWYREEFYRQPAFDVAVVDTVGCGDAFLASLLSSVLAGVSPGAALERASAVGALVAGTAGASLEISDAAVTRMLAQHSGSSY